MMRIYTVGYGALQTTARLQHILTEHKVQILFDVRSNVTGLYMKHGFDGPTIRAAIEPGIVYVHEARLGYKWKGPGTKHPDWRKALDELQVIVAGNTTVCLMCAEADPLTCHRGMWLQTELEARLIEVDHIETARTKSKQQRLAGLFTFWFIGGT